MSVFKIEFCVDHYLTNWRSPALVLVAIHLQTTSQDAKLQVTPITRFSIKGNLTWLRVATNPSKNMICLLLRDTILSTFKIFLLNWKTKFSTIIDTAIIHVCIQALYIINTMLTVV